jgi:malate dehydrogenase (oxaloacetate-decarboxylating)
MPILNKYRQDYCCFNDDIQGTAAVALGTLLSACRLANKKLSQMNVTFVGGGSAGCGIAEMLIQQMVHEGLDDAAARSRVFMVDRYGLITSGMTSLMDFQEKLAQDPKALSDWEISGEYASLLEVVQQAKPDILIGVSGVAGLFTQEVIETMAINHPLPIIFPLSNPSKRVEAHPKDVVEWTNGQVILATGSPFENVEYNGQTFPIAQCNNSYIFPGIGLGALVVKAKVISDEMLMASSNALAEVSPIANTGKGALLPPITDIQAISKRIAFAVAKVAIAQGHALAMDDETLQQRITKYFWTPKYREYKRVSL